MRKAIPYICFLISFFVSFTLPGQENSNFRFKKLQVTDGLSENAAYCILQDESGFMWFGTKDGLNRYDGSSFKVYQHQFGKKGSIGNNFIRSIKQMDKDHLYVGTDAGLYIMDKVTETFSKLILKASGNSSISSAVNALVVDKKGNLWIATMSQGLYIYSPKSQKLRKVEIEKTNLDVSTFWSVMEDRSGTIWAGTRAGLLRYNTQTNRLEIIHSITGKTGSTNNEILSMTEDNRGNLWLGTWAGGLLCYNKQTDGYTSYLNRQFRFNYVTHIRSVFQYTDEAMLIGSDDGLYLFNTVNGVSKRIDIANFKYSLSDQNVYSIARDKEGGIWIGTYFGGINYLNTSLLAIETYHPDLLQGFLSGKAISQFCEDPKGNIWIATEDGGVNYFNVKTKRITQPVRTTYHNTHALLLDGEDLWIGTFSRGIDVYNTSTKKLINHRNKPDDPNSIDNDCVFSLYKTKGGDIFVGTTVGLNKFDKKRREFIRIKEVSSFIYDIKEDDSGNLWLASYGRGAIKFDSKLKRWIYYDQAKRNDPIAGSKLTSIYVDSQRRLVFSSEGRGIFIYDKKGDCFRNISESEGLPNGVIYGVLDDPLGNLWLSSNKGLICLNTEEPDKFKLYNIENGLQSNQFNYKSTYKAKDGKFYFGGINGFNCFYPQDLNKVKNQILPDVAITQIKLLGNSDPEVQKQIQTSLNKKEAIKLRYNTSSFTISFVSLSFISPSKNQYAYKLEGADAGWNFSGNNKNVTYVNLPPGDYKFKVKASNNDGLWNEDGCEIFIEVLPPFWWSIPAKTLYVLLGVSLLYFVVKYYIGRNRIKQIRHLESFKTEQETKAFESKIEFFTTIAHEIRTPLSLIKAPLEEIIAAGEDNSQKRQNLSVIERNCDRLTVLINQLLDFRKMEAVDYMMRPERIDLKTFMVEMHERFKKAAQSKNIVFDLKLPKENGLFIQSDPEALTKIISNLLTNALKFTTSKIVLELKCNRDKSYTISVEDNGDGIPHEKKNLIFDPFYQIQSGKDNMGTGIGLSLVKHLTSLLGGNVEVADSEKGGSIFLFTFSDLNISQPEMLSLTEEKHKERDVFSISHEPTEVAILAVDDNSDMTDFISNCLSGDYAVDTAKDASIALKMLDEKNYSLVISDIMMPGIDGISFVKKIKSDLNYSHIPLILLSAKIENSTKAEGLRSGADVFIEKPFSTIYLKAQIASLLKNRKTLLDSFNRSPLAPYSSLATNKSDEYFLVKLNEEIEKHISNENFTVESLTDILNISRSNLQRKLKAISGYSPGDYLRNYRLRKACLLLLESDSRINEVAFRVGFNSASYFTKAFYKCYNMSPREFISHNSRKMPAP
ncbi:hybrid sensor histidine kinase/response regulator transcription factor [Arcticibacter tournemirensis]|uniref:histidine kinase n=1 Tax=Arcticibacter tournemirensis TaxID=699437 RepID=A0A4V1KHX1_9SPHI|nr:two-component regulator propeller domain-containing protein [Arcticibacter tournemirensis]RXF68672.1 response regulator [Arcticibacter tournemirensis]